MARKLRVNFEGAIYHVTVRGVERRRIFADDRDRERFLKRLGEAVEEYGVRLYLFCLMSNHVHMLVETPQGNLSMFMHKIQTAYTVYYNLRHGRAGHLMQGRFGAEPVQGDEYLLRLSRYIHLNPVCVRSVRALPVEDRVKQLRQYHWSSYRGYAGLAKAWGFIDNGPVLGLMGGKERGRRRAYGRFVESGLAESDSEFVALMREARWGVGDGEFQAHVRDMHTDLVKDARRTEDVSFRKTCGRLGSDVVLGEIGRAFGVEPRSLRKRQRGCVARAVAVLMLGRYAGMSQRDCAGYMGMGTGVAACLQLKSLRTRMEEDTALTERVTRISEALAKAATTT